MPNKTMKITNLTPDEEKVPINREKAIEEALQIWEAGHYRRMVEFLLSKGFSEEEVDKLVDKQNDIYE